MSYNTKVYLEQGGERLVVQNGGSIHFKTGAKQTNNAGSQAAHIANATGGATGAPFNLQTKFNSLLTAVRGVGILATS